MFLSQSFKLLYSGTPALTTSRKCLASDSGGFCVPRLWWSLFKSVRMGYVVYTSVSAVVSNRGASAVSILVWMFNSLELENNALCFVFTRVRLLTLGPLSRLLFLQLYEICEVWLKLSNKVNKSSKLFWSGVLNFTDESHTEMSGVIFQLETKKGK